MKRRLHIFLVLAFIFVHCKKESPFVSKDVIDKIEAKKNPTIGNVAFILENDVYYLKTFNGIPKQLTFSSTTEKKEIRVTHKGDKLAYLNSSGTPVIIDTLGNTLNTLFQFTNVQSMDWSQDDQTLYMLIDGKINFFGPAMNIPSITYSGVPSNMSPDLHLISISSNNDLAYSYTSFDPEIGYVYKVVFKKNDNTNKEQELAKVRGDKVKYLTFVNTTNELMVGYDYYDHNRELSKVEVYPYLGIYPSVFESSEEYVDPIYRSDLQYMVSAYRGASSESFILSAIRFFQNNEGNYYMNKYSVTNSNKIYVNWK
ncbi:MAG TPA: hypothetical protein VF691_01720 [Cytophagaceae bacterium]|jgi:hypothetical protein